MTGMTKRRDRERTMTEQLFLRDPGKDWTRLPVHLENGGFSAVNKALKMDSGAILDEVKKANLRGRGGAGFPAGVKWGFVPKESENERRNE